MALYNTASDNSGLHIGIVNSVDTANAGVQTGTVNYAEGKYEFIHSNNGKEELIYKEKTNNIQVGLVNMANNGWQIGILNHNAHSCFPYMALINYSANTSENE
ncbi:MAG: hypothetical protein WC637_07080 [Victivallales bacterium]|jgi:hypothetical protein